MPNRILRDWTDSEDIQKLSEGAEIFYTRLIMKADDYGRYSGNAVMIKNTLFPLKDEITIGSIKNWVKECQDAGILLAYVVDNRPYLQIEKFRQRLRTYNTKYPAPPAEIQTMNETEPEPETLVKTYTGNAISSEILLKDFPNSQAIEDVARITGYKKEILLKELQFFKPKANITYPSMIKFAEHFKNVVVKKMNDTKVPLTRPKKLGE
mgnify:CR=1 FL=1